MRANLTSMLLLLLGVAMTQAQAATRVALVIGNSKYTNLPDNRQLISPLADATDVAAALKSLGYTLINDGPITDASKEAMLNATEAFAAAAKGAEGAIFYYSGHGVQVGEDNYLLPSDAPHLTGISILKNRTVLLRDTVMVALEEAGARNKVIILDCCRDNPFAAQLDTSLAQVGKSMSTKSVGGIDGYGPGFYLAFATSPGTTADDGNGQRNSPFTAALLKTLSTSAGKDIDFFFRDVKRLLGGDQVSWTNHSLNDSFALALAGMDKAPVVTPPTGEGTVSMPPSPAPAPVEPGIAQSAPLLPVLPTGKELKNPQAREELTAAREQRKAQRMFEALNHLRSADLREPNHPEVLTEMALTYESMGLTVKARSYWTQVRNLGESESGGYHQLALSKLAVTSPEHSPLPQLPALPERGFFDTREVFRGTSYEDYNSYARSIVIRRAQTKLKETGHYHGTVDGGMGPSTQKAIISWQNKNGVEVTGKLDEKTQAGLQLLSIPESRPPAGIKLPPQSPRNPSPTPSKKSGKSEPAKAGKSKLSV